MKKIQWVGVVMVLFSLLFAVGCDNGTTNPGGGTPLTPSGGGTDGSPVACVKIDGTTEADGGGNIIALQITLDPAANLDAEDYTFSYKLYIESGSVQSLNFQAFQTSGSYPNVKGPGLYSGLTTGTWIEYSATVNASSAEFDNLFSGPGAVAVGEIRPLIVSENAGEAIVAYIKDVKLSNGTTDLVDSADGSVINLYYVPVGNDSTGTGGTDPALSQVNL